MTLRVITSEHGWSGVVSAIAIDAITNKVLTLWITAQQTPARALVAGLMNANNRGKPTLFNLGKKPIYLPQDDTFRVEELRAAAPGVGIACEIKLVNLKATGNVDSTAPFYILAEHPAGPEDDPPEYFIGRLKEVTHVAIIDEWAPWLWTQGHQPAQYVSPGPNGRMAEVEPIKPLKDADGCSAWKIHNDPSVWTSVVRRHFGLRHIVTVPPQRQEYRMYNIRDKWNHYHFDPRFAHWAWKLSDDGDTVMLSKNYTGEWEAAAEAQIAGDLRTAVQLAAARGGIEVELKEDANA